jgi:rhodanese-related sulfurtransferase
MSKRKITLLLFVLAAAILFIALSWFKQHYSMSIAQPYSVTVEVPEHHVLVATQGSDFKNAVVEGVVAQLKGRPVNIQVIDVTELLNIKVDDWDAIVVLHTWENWQAEPTAKLFIEQQPNLNKIIVLTTSGDGHLKMPGVDAITSASLLQDVAKHVDLISRRIDKLFNKTAVQTTAEDALVKYPFTCEALPLQENDTSDNNQDTCEKQVWGAAHNVVAYKHLFISEQPDDITFAIAKENAVAVVIDLREPAEFAAFEWKEADAAKNAGLVYYNLGIPSSGDSFEPQAMRQITQLVHQHKNQKILLHCSSGNRASAWLAIHMVQDHETDLETAIALATKTGLTHPKIEARVRQYLTE